MKIFNSAPDSVVWLLALLPALVACQQSGDRRNANGCYHEVHGQKLFIGDRECLRMLPTRRMSGIWILGNEFSVFFEGEKNVPQISTEGPDSLVWLEADTDQLLASAGKHFDGRTHAYEIDFIGTKSTAPGLYGHFGQFKQGVLVKRLIALKQIR